MRTDVTPREDPAHRPCQMRRSPDTLHPAHRIRHKSSSSKSLTKRDPMIVRRNRSSRPNEAALETIPTNRRKEATISVYRIMRKLSILLPGYADRSSTWPAKLRNLPHTLGSTSIRSGTDLRPHSDPAFHSLYNSRRVHPELEDPPAYPVWHPHAIQQRIEQERVPPPFFTKAIRREGEPWGGVKTRSTVGEGEKIYPLPIS